MIDNFSLAVSHGLMMLAAILLLLRPDLDRDDAPASEDQTKAKKRRWGRPGA